MLRKIGLLVMIVFAGVGVVACDDNPLSEGRDDIDRIDLNPSFATALLELARQYASECLECSGLGYTLGPKAEHVDCPDCEGIRAVIARAEGSP